MTVYIVMEADAILFGPPLGVFSDLDEARRFADKESGRHVLLYVVDAHRATVQAATRAQRGSRM